MLYINRYDCDALIEDIPTEDSLPLPLDERSTKCLQALLALESFEVSYALAQLYRAGVIAGKQSPVPDVPTVVPDHGQFPSRQCG